MSAVRPRAYAANDNEPWSDEAYFPLIDLSGKVLKAILNRVAGRRCIEAREIAEIIRQVCRQSADPMGRRCPETLAIEKIARRLESDDRCV